MIYLEVLKYIYPYLNYGAYVGNRIYMRRRRREHEDI